ncbi:hypothetical protein ACOME3_000151 [Neoechinorhynchus agilis]
MFVLKSPVSGFALNTTEQWPPALFIYNSGGGDSNLSVVKSDSSFYVFAPKHHLTTHVQCASRDDIPDDVKKHRLDVNEPRVAVGLSDGRILLFDFQSPKPTKIVIPTKQPLVYIRFISPNEMFIVFNNGTMCRYRDGEITDLKVEPIDDRVICAVHVDPSLGLLGCESGRILHMYEHQKRLGGHTSPVSMIKANGFLAVSVGIDDFYVGVWCLKSFDFNGIASIPLATHPIAIDCIDSSRLVLVMDERTLSIFNLSDLSTQRVFHLEKQMIDAVFLTDSRVGIVAEDYSFDSIEIDKTSTIRDKPTEIAAVPEKRAYNENQGETVKVRPLTFLDLI